MVTLVKGGRKGAPKLTRNGKRIGRPPTGSAMEERRSIRLTEGMAAEIDDLARRSQRTVPAMVRVLLTIGLVHRDEVAAYFD